MCLHVLKIAMKRKVSEPTTATEFEIQAQLLFALRELGLNVRGEVKSAYEGRSTVRFDLAVFKDGQLTGIIEVRKSPIKHKTTWGQTRQGLRYASFGVPVRIVYGPQEAHMLVEQARLGKLWDGTSS